MYSLLEPRIITFKNRKSQGNFFRLLVWETVSGSDYELNYVLNFKLIEDTEKWYDTDYCDCANNSLEAVFKKYSDDDSGTVILAKNDFFLDPEKLHGNKIGTWLFNRSVLWAKQFSKAKVSSIGKIGLSINNDLHYEDRLNFYRQFGFVTHKRKDNPSYCFTDEMPVSQLKTVDVDSNLFNIELAQTYIRKLVNELHILKAADKNKISVIVLSYNYEKFIKDNLQSLLNQTDSNFEIVVVDDGSKDKSCDVINSIIAQNASSIKINFYCHENHQNKGIIESYKFALSKCKGDYIAFCEADDYWHKDYIRNLKDTIKSTKASFIACKICCVNQSSNSKYDDYVEHCNQRLERISVKQESVFRYLLKGNTLPTFSAICVKRSEILACDFNTVYPPYLDLWLWRQIGIKHNIAFSSASICYWRKHDSSYDMVNHLSELQDFFIANNELLLSKYLNSKFSDFILSFIYNHFSKKMYLKFQNKFLRYINKRIVCK